MWLGLHEPSEVELEDVAVAFGLHHLAVEDAVNAHQRPKLERYEDTLFLVLKTLWYVDAEDAVETGEINMFVGSDFIVTVRHGQGSELHSARLQLESQRACSPTARPRSCTPSATRSSTATPRCWRRSRWTSTRSRSRSSPPPAPTTRSGSTRSSARSPRYAGR